MDEKEDEARPLMGTIFLVPYLFNSTDINDSQWGKKR